MGDPYLKDMAEPDDEKIERLETIIETHQQNWSRVFDYLHSWLPNECFSMNDADRNAEQIIAAIVKITGPSIW